MFSGTRNITVSQKPVTNVGMGLEGEAGNEMANYYVVRCTMVHSNFSTRRKFLLQASVKS